ncbi:aminoglycoside 3'-phosphotransferase [Acidipropionibacterium acidipropionici]|uniref:aminoglycoside 3'-phosphotransferase n=1 Tax=Acidipropionibacterium acidipropionici TaxID=1748 RepID=UPI00110ABFAC|nr:aminoglycoside 3'-phosphotransferase [Acidipropionibacterium acidipropionici]QCV95521.1 aminoglycoside 3'-phosphotransferase [Acidipropionibacterium acidipropionici]
MSVRIPPKVAEMVGDGPAELVWRNELGGLTYRTSGRGSVRYIKWQPAGDLEADERDDVDLLVESEKMRWAGRFIRVPRVLGVGADEHGSWLVTEGIEATSAVDPRWRSRPEDAVRVIATGLRRMHDAHPVDTCPYRATWSTKYRAELPEPEHLVVCHGDPCMPNTLMDRDGQFAGHVDLARLGVGDRWSDLAIATYSISWDVNLGRNYDDLFLATYGVEPDDDRIRAYRALWDAPARDVSHGSPVPIIVE